uniref:Uncharacterized protein n=1 Tax=Setaria italica TaxID=4555 RepID=K3XUA6_SETIT
MLFPRRFVNRKVQFGDHRLLTGQAATTAISNTAGCGGRCE